MILRAEFLLKSLCSSRSRYFLASMLILIGGLQYVVFMTKFSETWAITTLMAQPEFQRGAQAY